MRINTLRRMADRREHAYDHLTMNGIRWQMVFIAISTEKATYLCKELPNVTVCYALSC